MARSTRAALSAPASPGGHSAPTDPARACARGEIGPRFTANFTRSALAAHVLAMTRGASIPRARNIRLIKRFVKIEPPRFLSRRLSWRR